MQKFVYDGKFERYVLVVGRTGCRKAFFVQRVAVNNIFGELEKTEWVSQITPSERREAQIQSCFTSHV